jgi:DNA-binding CsgD family transcriptional regulator
MKKILVNELIKSNDIHEYIINEVDIIIQITEIIDNKHFKTVWKNDYYTEIIKSFSEAYNPLEMIKIDEILAALKKPRKPYSVVHKYESASNSYKWYYTNINPYEYNESGELTHVICTSIDLTGKAYNPERFTDMQKELKKLQHELSISNLSKTEIKILQLLASGKSEKEIADIQSRSIHTVKTHLKNIRTKLNCNKNTELVKFAIETGIG